MTCIQIEYVIVKQLFYYFILSPLRLQLEPQNVIVRSLFAFICLCMLACLCVYVFTHFFRVIASRYYAYVLCVLRDLCVYLLLLYLYDLCDYNKCMTSPHQSNASCGPIFSISCQSNVSENLQAWVSPMLDPQGPSTRQIIFVQQSLHFMHIFYFFLGSLPFLHNISPIGPYV